jgi:hypothetical protein
MDGFEVADVWEAVNEMGGGRGCRGLSANGRMRWCVGVSFQNYHQSYTDAAQSRGKDVNTPCSVYTNPA